MNIHLPPASAGKFLAVMSSLLQELHKQGTAIDVGLIRIAKTISQSSPFEVAVRI